VSSPDSGCLEQLCQVPNNSEYYVFAIDGIFKLRIMLYCTITEPKAQEEILFELLTALNTTPSALILLRLVYQLVIINA